MSIKQDTEAVRAILAEHCESCGIPSFGICELSGFQYLPSHKQKLLPEGGSILIFVLPYYAGDFPGRNVSLYAVGDDYHPIASALLSPMVQALSQAFPEKRFLSFSDAGPIPEVQAALRAGLGFRGVNRQFITEAYGSLCFLAEIVTDLVLTPDAPLPQKTCEGCGACLRICPTGALTAEGFCAEKCRSAITQKKRGLSEWEEQQIAAGGFAWGCDLCTLVCPHNHGVPLTPIAAFREHPDPMLTPENCASLCKRKSYSWRGEAVLRRNLALTGK